MSATHPGVTDAISAHHRELSEHLAAEVAALEARESDGSGLVAFLIDELLPHAAGEEGQLYPVVDRLVALHGTPTATMQLDHEYIKSATGRVAALARRIRDASDASDEAARAAALRELTRAAIQLEAVFGLHTSKEERAYLPLVARYLSPSEQGRLRDDLHETAAAHSSAQSAAQSAAQGATITYDDERGEKTLDVRSLPPAQRHSLIFQTFEALEPGGAFILVNDHDPKPLSYQLRAEQQGGVSWEYLVAGPTEWRVRIGKLAK